MLRKIIITLLGVGLIAGAGLLAKSMAEKKKTPPRKEEKVIRGVFADTVQNSKTPISVSTNGTIEAFKRLALFSEVTGIFESTGRGFNAGEYYKEGDVLLQVNSDEHRANIRSQKSGLYNQVVMMLPDLRIDYPASFPNWEKYVKDFDMNRPVMDFPTPVSDQEKLFIAGRNLLTTYYNIKNLEERLSKFTIYAPFNGMLTAVNTDPGSLISPGQNLGTFISPSVYEMEVAVSTQYMNLMQVGKKVKLHNSEGDKSWTGSVVRVNGAMNPGSQTIQVFIQVRGKGLVEGMYLEADIAAKDEKDTYEIDRKLVVNDNQIYAIRNSKIELIRIDPIFFNEKNAIVKGLANGEVILAKSVPGAFPGMSVNIIE